MLHKSSLSACKARLCPQCICFRLGISAPLQRRRGLRVSPPRATSFGKTQRRQRSRPSHPVFRLGRKIPSLNRSFRGPPRRAIPGPSRLSRHPCRSTPETPIQRGLLKGALRSMRVFLWRSSRLRARAVVKCPVADSVRDAHQRLENVAPSITTAPAHRTTAPVRPESPSLSTPGIPRPSPRARRSAAGRCCARPAASPR